MKITPWFTHPQAILGVYDFLLSNKSELFKKMSWLFQALTLEWMVAKSLKPQKSASIDHKKYSTWLREAVWSKVKRLCQNNIPI